MSSNKKIYTAAIIGAGRIGSGFDAPGAKRALTHAHAIAKHPRMRLVALVDTDARRGKREAQRWNTAFYAGLDEMYAKEKPDIIVIATPDGTHATLLADIVALRPKLLICEKPIAATPAQAARLRRLFARSRVPVIVNYTRRFDKTVVALRGQLRAGRFGKVVCASALYTGGLLHNGSHAVDLARYLFGEMTGTSGGAATFERCPRFYCMDGGEEFFVFEFDILTERGRLRFSDSGFARSAEAVVRDRLYRGFRNLGKPVRRTTELEDALPELYRHARAVLEGAERPRSSAQDALNTYEACMRIAKQ